MTTSNPHDGIVIPFGQMFEAIQAIERTQAEQGGTLKAINTKLDQVITATGDHESRIRSLEKKVWGASGLAGSLGGILGYVVSLLR